MMTEVSGCNLQYVDDIYLKNCIHILKEDDIHNLASLLEFYYKQSMNKVRCIFLYTHIYTLKVRNYSKITLKQTCFVLLKIGCSERLSLNGDHI